MNIKHIIQQCNEQTKRTNLGIITEDASESQYLFIFKKLSFFLISDKLIISNNTLFMICWDKDIFSDVKNGNIFN